MSSFVCLTVCLSVCLSVWLYDCSSVCLSICLSVLIFLFVCLSVLLVVVCMFVYLSFCLTVCLSFCPSFCLSNYLYLDRTIISKGLVSQVSKLLSRLSWLKRPRLGLILKHFKINFNLKSKLIHIYIK